MVFWVMVVWVLAVGFFLKDSLTTRRVCDDGAIEYSSSALYSFLLFLLPVILVGLRSDFIDTASYIYGFERAPATMSKLVEHANLRDHSKLFYGLEVVFKVFVTENAQVWIALIAVLQGFLIMRTLRKYSCDLMMSTYLLVTSAMVAQWMCNGMRQFIAVAILFACTRWLLENKWYFYLPLAVLLMGLTPITKRLGIEAIPWYLDGIHQSVLIMILAYFFIPGKAFNKRVWILAAFFAVLIVTGGIDAVLDTSVENTTYVKDMEYVEADTGTSWQRVLFTAIPMVLSLIVRKEFDKEQIPPIIHLAVNASVITTVLYIASAFTSGIFVGRLPIYTEVYSLILVPWLLRHPYRKYGKYLTVVVMLLYAFFLFYQINVTWKHNVFRSEILGINV
ncbi:MAG: EpsG family protein [Clostridia bacterium]|nr:EpsG family protein [Clostridia bacterium]